jgi:UDP-N-acetylmuramoyl-tripeptide--D-alanyl-D-alanine ligase
MKRERGVKFLASEIVEATRGKLVHGKPSLPFADVSTDSRTIEGKELFIPLTGPHFDAHEFIPAAFRKGARGTLLKQGLPLEKAGPLRKSSVVIEVKNPLKALGDIAALWRKKHPIPLVAITGSNGKTTAKELTHSILSQRFRVLKSEGNWNNLIGVPLTLLKLSSRHEVAVLEMGMNHRGEIRRLAHIARPTVGVITNVAPAHLKYLKSIEEIALAKGELLESLPDGGTAVLNRDDPLVRKMSRLFCGPQVTFGLGTRADVGATNVRLPEESGSRFTLHTEGNHVSVALSLLGKPNVYNALAAAAVATAFSLNVGHMKKGLERVKPFRRRMELITLPSKSFLIDDTYNANPSSAEGALRTLKHLKGRGRSHVVLGDMLELGKAAVELHFQLGGTVASLSVDYLWLLGRHAREVARGAAGRGMEPQRIFVARSHQELASHLAARIGPRDWILVKGSRAMAMEKIADYLLTARRRDPHQMSEGRKKQNN